MPNEQQIREIIQDELSNFLASDRYTFQKHIQIFDGRNVQTGRTTGTKIGTASDQKLGLWGVVPVDQPETVADPSGGGDAGVDIPARNAINAIIDRLQEIGAIK